jgi:hypothetical protein
MTMTGLQRRAHPCHDCKDHVADSWTVAQTTAKDSSGCCTRRGLSPAHQVCSLSLSFRNIPHLWVKDARARFGALNARPNLPSRLRSRTCTAEERGKQNHHIRLRVLIIFLHCHPLFCPQHLLLCQLPSRKFCIMYAYQHRCITITSFT